MKIWRNWDSRCVKRHFSVSARGKNVVREAIMWCVGECVCGWMGSCVWTIYVYEVVSFCNLKFAFVVELNEFPCKSERFESLILLNQYYFSIIWRSLWMLSVECWALNSWMLILLVLLLCFPYWFAVKLSITMQWNNKFKIGSDLLW